MADPAVQVRKLLPAEAEAFRSIRLEALQESPDAFGASLEGALAEPLAFFVQGLERNDVFGAFQAGALVGMAGFYALDGPKTRHKGILWGMYVKPNARGSGVAAALVDRIVAQAAGRVELIELTVVTANARAVHFYRKMGFSSYGVEKRALKHYGVYFDEELMVRFLDPTLSD
jgi:ribosomal protein S18 acetylase RimI-like enzyme